MYFQVGYEKIAGFRYMFPVWVLKSLWEGECGVFGCRGRRLLELGDSVVEGLGWVSGLWFWSVEIRLRNRVASGFRPRGF